jgi:GAF domain-containing protein
MNLEGQGLRGTVADELQDMVLDSSDVDDFLRDLAEYTAKELSGPGRPVICGITVLRHRKPATRAASSSAAFAMDEVQNDAGDGPCLAAMREFRTVYVPDVRASGRWPELAVAAGDRGYLSILGVPVELDNQTLAALNLYASGPSAFSTADIALAEKFADQASKSLRLALRMSRLRDTRDDMAAAMESRTVIDMAVGVVMAQNRCTPQEAFALLRSASNTRNVKLREVAAGIIASITGSAGVKAHFQE